MLFAKLVKGSVDNGVYTGAIQAIRQFVKDCVLDKQGERGHMLKLWTTRGISITFKWWRDQPLTAEADPVFLGDDTLKSVQQGPRISADNSVRAFTSLWMLTEKVVPSGGYTPTAIVFGTPADPAAPQAIIARDENGCYLHYSGIRSYRF